MSVCESKQFNYNKSKQAKHKSLIPPALYGYNQTNNEVYYNLAKSLPDDMDYVIANSKLSKEFDIASTHMLLVDKNLSPKSVRDMTREMEQVDGVKYVLGLESVIGPRVPEEVLPESITGLLQSGKWELLLLNSEYPVASDEVGAQIESLNTILKNYDPTGMLIGEAPCMKDMIDVTSHDFEVVNAVSIVAIFINLGLPHYLGQSLPFIAPICISTIQLGATVDYAILMTTRYKSERIHGQDKKEAVRTALTISISSILVSGFGLFAATFGVALYSKIDMISSICMLLARGAVISMLCVILILPALLLLLDKVICVTTLGMKQKNKTEQELPVDLAVSYKLAGKPIQAEDPVGKSGRVTIRFDYQNKQVETVEIDGRQEKIYVPFAMLTGALLDDDVFTNVEVTNGKLVDDGSRTAVIGIAFPGLQENLGLSKDKLEIPDYVEITADVSSFQLDMIAENHSLDEVTAHKEFYDSKVYSLLEQEDTKLWHLSALTLFNMYEEEKQTGSITFSEEA